MPKSRSTAYFTGKVLQGEDGQDAALGAELARVAEGAERAEASGRILSAVTRGHADAAPAADAGKDRHILLTVRPL
jgi:hypothetical protein